MGCVRIEISAVLTGSGRWGKVWGEGKFLLKGDFVYELFYKNIYFQGLNT